MKPERVTHKMLATRAPKAQYTEMEAAEALEISVEQLRCLVRDKILDGEEGGAPLSQASYQPSDLLVLRILSHRLLTATARG